MSKKDNPESIISDKFQVRIPKVIQEKAKLKTGDTLIWQYDEEKKQIIITPIPNNMTDELFDIGRIGEE
jgi:bifunctional DNA-binding transcriptional regulator/antitoxin component of YhaV-PrlF toxin-antitoxin module